MKNLIKFIKLKLQIILILFLAIDTFPLPIQAKPKLYSKQVIKPREIHIALTEMEENALTQTFTDPLDSYGLTEALITSEFRHHRNIADASLKGAASITPTCIGIGAAFGAVMSGDQVYKAVHDYLKSPALASITGGCVGLVGGIVGAVGGAMYGTFATASVPYYKLKKWKQTVDARKTLERNLEKVCQSKSYKTLGKATQNLLAHSENITKLPYKIFRDINEFDQQKVFFKGERITSQHPLARKLIGTVSYFPEISCAAEAKDIVAIEAAEKLAEAGANEESTPNSKFTYNKELAEMVKSIIGHRQDKFTSIKPFSEAVRALNGTLAICNLRDRYNLKHIYKRKVESNSEKEEKQREKLTQE